ncbi:hypothetical protein ACFL5Z_13370, partial [Planctomycetota bacterium]
MLDLKERILEAYASTAKLRRDLVKDGTKEYFEAEGSGNCPESADLDIAQTRLRSFLKKKLLSSAWLSATSGGVVSDDRSVANQGGEIMLRGSIAFFVMVGLMLGSIILFPAAAAEFSGMSYIDNGVIK